MANKPIIRFNEYSDEWEEITLSDIAEIVDRKTDEQSNAPVMMISAASGFINQSEKYSTDNAGSSLKNYILLKKGELAYNHGYSALRNFGSCFTLEKDEARIPFVYHCFSIPSQNPYFYGYYLNCGIFDKQLRKLVASTARMDGLLNISYSDYTSIKVKKPSKNEQKEIAIFFKNINKLVVSTEEKLEKSIVLKKSMLEKMFPKNGAKVPELRFSGFNDEWQVKELGKYAEKITEKNIDNLYSEVFTNSAEYGIISQNDYFEREIANKNNLNGYYVARPDVFVYNPRVSKTAPVGPIKRNKLGRIGVLSPLYFVFQTYDFDLTFLDYFFDGYSWHQFMSDNGNTGARFDRFSINEDSFLKMPIPTPSIEEQQKIGNFFVQLDSMISSYRNEFEKLKTIKKSLLEKMFV